MPRLRSHLGPSAATLASRIRAERLRLGHTQEIAATVLKVRRTTYRQLELSANPQISTVVGLVLELGMDARALVPELFGPLPE